MKTVRIIENYRDWKPPFDAKQVVIALLGRLPVHYCAGLESVVLTCAGRMNRRRRRAVTRSRGRKVKIADCLGLYHGRHRGEGPWIELFVDNIVGRHHPRAFSLPPYREMLVGDVLFHELGHHLHATQLPEHREAEDVAERWQQRLLDRHVIPRYWLWLPAMLGMILIALMYRTAGAVHRAMVHLPRAGY